VPASRETPHTPHLPTAHTLSPTFTCLPTPHVPSLSVKSGAHPYHFCEHYYSLQFARSGVLRTAKRQFCCLPDFPPPLVLLVGLPWGSPWASRGAPHGPPIRRPGANAADVACLTWQTGGLQSADANRRDRREASLYLIYRLLLTYNPGSYMRLHEFRASSLLF
jgi:hypothetical protein